MTLSEHKKQLIAQGALHRADMLLAKHALSANARPEVFMGNALQHLATSASEIVGRRIGNLSAADLQTLAPIVLPLLVRLFQKKGLAKAALGTAAVSAIIGYVFSHREKLKTAHPSDALMDERNGPAVS